MVRDVQRDTVLRVAVQVVVQTLTLDAAGLRHSSWLDDLPVVVARAVLDGDAGSLVSPTRGALAPSAGHGLIHTSVHAHLANASALRNESLLEVVTEAVTLVGAGLVDLPGRAPGCGCR